MAEEFTKIVLSKQRMRRRLADLPYAQKLRLLDELRGEAFVRLPEEAKPDEVSGRQRPAGR